MADDSLQIQHTQPQVQPPSSSHADFSEEYKQTASAIVNTLGTFARTISNDVARNGTRPPERGWSVVPPSPQGVIGVAQEVGGKSEVISYDTGTTAPSAASYFCATVTPPDVNKQVVSEIRIGHDGLIETRDYTFPPENGMPIEPPFSPIAGNHETLAAILARIMTITGNQ